MRWATSHHKHIRISLCNGKGALATGALTYPESLWSASLFSCPPRHWRDGSNCDTRIGLGGHPTRSSDAVLGQPPRYLDEGVVCHGESSCLSRPRGRAGRGDLGPAHGASRAIEGS